MSRRKAKRRKKRKRPHSGPSRTPPRPSKKSRLRRRWLAILVGLGGAVGLYAFDRSGQLETVPAEVVDLRTYPHTPVGGEAHTHTDAVIEYEGRQHTLERADDLSRGEWVEVSVRRGRLSGWPHYVAFLGAVEIDLLESEATGPQPWEYDLVLNRHWDPQHGHWHDGPPPSQR